MKVLAVMLTVGAFVASGCAAQGGGMVQQAGGDGSVNCLEGQTAKNGQCVSGGGAR